MLQAHGRPWYQPLPFRRILLLHISWDCSLLKVVDCNSFCHLKNNYFFYVKYINVPFQMGHLIVLNNNWRSITLEDKERPSGEKKSKRKRFFLFWRPLTHHHLIVLQEIPSNTMLIFLDELEVAKLKYLEHMLDFNIHVSVFTFILSACKHNSWYLVCFYSCHYSPSVY